MRGALVLALLAAAGCRRGPDVASNGAADAMPTARSEEASTAAVAVVSPRCRPTGRALGLTAPDELELGAAVPFDGGYAIGLVHRTSAGRVEGVALVDKEVTSARVLDLGPTPGDAPPPVLAMRGRDLLVAAYALPGTGDVRPLGLTIVSPNGTTRALASIPQQRDDSFAFDVAGGLVVWDEASAGAAPRGVIRGASVGAERAGTSHDMSPPDSDAEMPRIVALGRDVPRYFVVWIARRPEPTKPADAGPAEEAPGEPRAQSWLEAVTVDGAGVTTGSVRRLTTPTGHVSAFDVERLDRETHPTVLVVARDDGEATDGSGGTLLRVRLREDGIDPPLAFSGDGLGRGAPALVDASAPWLAWVGPHEELRLLPLDPAGAPSALPSAEPLLEDARLLAVLGSASGRDAGDRLLVGVPGDAAASLRIVACVR